LKRILHAVLLMKFDGTPQFSLELSHYHLVARMQPSFVAFAFLFLANVVSAWYGTVTFYEDVGFEGQSYPWDVWKTQHCYNLACWDNKASSVKWKNLPSKGSLHGESRIAFYTDKDCKGDVRHWPTEVNGHYAEDLTLDGVNDKVTSFMIWETSKSVTNGYDLPCPWGTS